MRRITIYLEEEEYERVRKDAFYSRISLSSFFKKFIPKEFTSTTHSSLTSSVTDYSSNSNKIKKPKTIEIKANSLCKHGFQSGLCKFGCK